MPWGRIDDSLYDHPKLYELGRYRLPCLGLWTVAISWANRYLTDGHIPTDQVKRLGGTPLLAEMLVRVGLWDKVADGYRVHDFFDYNDSAADVRARRLALREAGQRGGFASGEARRLKRDGSQGLNSVPLPSVPIPVLTRAKAVDKSKSDA